MDESLVLCRLLHYGAAMLLFGASLFQDVLAPRDLAHALASRMTPLLKLAAVISLVTAVVWLLVTTGQMGEGWGDVFDPRAWMTVLGSTAFGRVWQIHILLGLSLAALLLLGNSEHRPATVVILSALHLGSLGFIGHAAMLSGLWGWINRGSHVLHLLAAGFWLGALLPLAHCLRWLDRPDLRVPTGVALRRFSGLGHGAVAVVFITGVTNTALVLRAWPLDLASPYQALLLTKIGVVGLMVGIAIVNRYRLVPKLKDCKDALRQLRAMTMVEMILGIIAIGLVSLLGTLEPT